MKNNSTWSSREEPFQMAKKDVYFKSGVRPERTGWRDVSLSYEHRKWGVSCTSVDIDYLVVEYIWCNPVALIEYKHERASYQDLSCSTFRVLSNLGDCANLPVFVVRYSSDFTKWNVLPLNGIAKKWKHSEVTMTKLEYVTFLYKLRGEILPEGLFSGAVLRNDVA